MTTQIDVVDTNDNTNDNTDETPVEGIKPEEVKPKAKPRAKAKAKAKEETCCTSDSILPCLDPGSGQTFVYLQPFVIKRRKAFATTW